jgi:FkbM family methyltransferase
MTGEAPLTASNKAEGDVDRLVFHTFFGDTVTDGVFVDVGAARPDYLSVSAFFRRKGWRVLAIEPNPEFADLHRKLGHELYPYACGPEDRDDADFSVVNSHGTNYEGGSVSYESFSSLAVKEEYAKLAKGPLDVTGIKVNIRRLDRILAEAGVNKVDVVSIDVEGWELEVLKGLDTQRWQPGVLIIENLLQDTRYRTTIEALGFRLWRSPFPNQVFVDPQTLARRSWWHTLRDRLHFAL